MWCAMLQSAGVDVKVFRYFGMEIFRSGLIASLLMMPVGFAFKALGMRVGHYGPKLAELIVTNPGPAFLFVQHLFIGWLSTLPLLVLMWHLPLLMGRWMWGFMYGACYYVLVNALALPLLFHDPLPWSLGWGVMMPSFTVHVVFGLAISLTVRLSLAPLREEA